MIVYKIDDNAYIIDPHDMAIKSWKNKKYGLYMVSSWYL